MYWSKEELNKIRKLGYVKTAIAMAAFAIGAAVLHGSGMCFGMAEIGDEILKQH